MNELKKFDLNFDKTLEYVNYNLAGGNTLSLALLKSVDFKSGNFFTLLPNDANKERIYEFETGMLLKQNPEIECFSSGKKCSFSEIPTIQDEISEYIISKASDLNNLSYVFEEVLTSPQSAHLSFFRDNDLLYTHLAEVYYIIKPENLNLENVLKCVEKSNAIWHSLCVLTNSGFGAIEDNHQLSGEKILEICTNCSLVMIGAYDGEAYIFWERNNSHFIQ